MGKVEALIFDMDGLIFDSERVVQRSWNEAGTALGYGRVGEQIYHTLGFNVKRREAYFKSIYGQDFPMEEFGNLTRKVFYDIAESEGIAMKKGVRELMDFARERGIRIGLATSSRQEYSVRQLTEAGIWEYFDGCVFGDMVTKAKPNPEIYLKACEAVGVCPAKSMALEDAPAGIRASHAAGMIPVMVPDLVEPMEEIRKLCYRRVDSLIDVILLVEELEK